MADYDPAAPAYEPSDQTYGSGEDQYDQQEETGEEDDDYDPSSFEGANDADATFDRAPTDPSASTKHSEQPSQPKTIGGFMVEDDEDDGEEQSNTLQESRPDGMGNPQFDHGAMAVSASEVQDVPIASEAQDTAAVVSAQGAGLNGSIPPVPPTPASASTPIPPSTNGAPLQDAVFATSQGKQAQTSTPAPAFQGSTPTPQPHTTATAPPPQAHTNGSIPTAAAAQRLPHDKVGQLEGRIKDDPKADVEAWQSLIAHYREKDQFDNARKVYSRYLDVFPSAASIWVEYVKMELQQNNMPNVEQIFARCLLQLPDVEMWSVYLDYLRRVHPLINDADGTKRGYISQAFDLLLKEVGIDPDAGNLWREYIDFIRGGPGVIGGSGWQDAQKGDLLRKAYQRAIALPHTDLTKLWKEYDNFELSMNKATGRKYLQEQSPHYMTARTARTQIERVIDRLDRRALPKLPPLYGCTGEDEFATQVEQWRGWIAVEKEDPLVLKDDEPAAYRTRVLYAYKQATMQLRFYPEIWYEAAIWCFEQNIDEMTVEGEKLLDAGIQACPESVLLALKKADKIESSLDAGSSDEVAVENGTKLEVPYADVLDSLYALHKKTQERRQKTIDGVKEYFASLPSEDEFAEAQATIEDDDDDDDDSPVEKPKSRAEQQQLQLQAITAEFHRLLETLKHTISAIWVAKLRAFRRIQGQGNPNGAKKGFRGVFKEARPRGQLTSEVYIANALMEWQVYRDGSAKKIFERGLKLFPTDEGFALEYVKFLVNQGDEINARGVFETVVGKISNAPVSATLNADDKKRKLRGLFVYMHEYESSYGDLAQVQKLERRMRELWPEEPAVEAFGARFTLPSFDPMRVQLVISPTQALPKPAGPALVLPSIEQPIHPAAAGLRATPDSNIRLGPNGPYVASPKRGLEDSDTDAPARKYARGESPLKGAAGRRINQPAISNPIATTGGGGSAAGFVTKSYIPTSVQPALPSPLPREINYLLSIIPHASSYRSTTFDAHRMVEFLRGLNVEGLRGRV